MKNLLIIFILLALLGAGCNKDYLERYPKTSITPAQYFNTPTDLQIYSNDFYSQISAQYSDLYSDNISMYTMSTTTENLIRGAISPSTVGGWSDWGTLRQINVLLANADKAQGDPVAIKHYIGIAKFFRALYYINKVQTYGDVPWYSAPIDLDDTANLYKAKDPRTLVVDSIMSDLEYAAANISTSISKDNSRVTQWAAYTLLAKFALWEGTFREYHTELNLTPTVPRFLQRAASATDTVINNGGFSIVGSSADDYRSLFTSSSLSGNKEVIFLQVNSSKLGIANNTHIVYNTYWALSNTLANQFLMADGTPFTAQPGYATESFLQIFNNRDPRFAETIAPPGFSTTPGGSPSLTNPAFGGLMQVKFYPRDPAQRGGWILDYTDLPIFRYAEILLINAEAKAELGTLTQTDLDNTINRLRDRVGMPHLSLANANANPDPYMAGLYPLVTGANQGVILEIRRERNAEMSCEGLRFLDLLRWKAGNLLANAPQGIYIAALGGQDVTGDGVPDLAIFKDQSSAFAVPGLPSNAPVYYADGSNGFYLSNTTSGFIMLSKDLSSPRQWLDKYYYLPIPLSQTVLNPNLTQPPGW